jgi:hypothetical protein
MKASKFILFLTLIVSFAFVTSASAAYYIVQDKMGKRAVTDSMPGYGWTVLFGPYETKDAAMRDSGVGTSSLPGDIAGAADPAVTQTGQIIPEFLASDIEFEAFEVPEAVAPRRQRAEAAPREMWEREATRGREAMAPAAESADIAVFALKGKAAIDRDGKDIGRFDHVVISRDGKVDYVVLSHDRKFKPIPWNALEISAEKDALVVHLNKDQLASAPSVERRDFLFVLASPDFKDKIHGFYESGEMRAGAEIEAPEMQKSADEAAALERHMQEAESVVESPQKMEE